jgi:hypothetical protein
MLCLEKDSQRPFALKKLPLRAAQRRRRRSSCMRNPGDAPPMPSDTSTESTETQAAAPEALARAEKRFSTAEAQLAPAQGQTNAEHACACASASRERGAGPSSPSGSPAAPASSSPPLKRPPPLPPLSREASPSPTRAPAPTTPTAGTVRVRLERAAGLKPMDPYMKPVSSDPYVKLSLAGNEQRSRIVSRDLNPRWGQDFCFDGELDALTTEPLQLRVFDHDLIGRDNFIGEASVELSALRGSTRRHEAEVALSVQGHVYLQLTWEPSSPPGEPSEVDLEIEIMKSLRHGHVATMYDVLRDARGDTFLVLEFLPGGPLLSGASLTCDPLDASIARRHARDALCGLAYLHGAGVVHGDIKPSNLLLTSKGRLKLADFGVSRFRSKTAKAASADVAGAPIEQHESTPLFTAPELLSGAAPEPPVDLWALGVTVWLVLFGSPPFDPGSLKALYEAIEKQPLPPPPTDDAALGGFLCGLLTREPAARLTAAQASEHMWVAAEEWTPLDAPPRDKTSQKKVRDRGRMANHTKPPRARRRSASIHEGSAGALVPAADAMVEPAADEAPAKKLPRQRRRSASVFGSPAAALMPDAEAHAAGAPDLLAGAAMRRHSSASNLKAACRTERPPVAVSDLEAACTRARTGE